jgi:hypothetical protein
MPDARKKNGIGSPGPDMLDVTALWGCLERDTSLRIVTQVTPLRVDGLVSGLRLVVRYVPQEETGTPWRTWAPVDQVYEWTAQTGRTYPAFLWHALFATYSLSFPSEWPKLEQLPLPT